MSSETPAPAWFETAAIPARERPRLSFDVDVDLCVIGGGLAGLSIAREAVRRDATVAVIEAKTVAWGASGHTLGTVMPGYGCDIADLVARVGRDDARELWALSQLGVESVRATIAESGMPDLGVTHGALEVSHTDNGDQLVGRLQMLGEEFGADVEGWQTEQVRDAVKTPRYFHAVHYPGAFNVHGLSYVRALAESAERAGVQIFENTRVISIDPAGVRKRIVTDAGRLRAAYIVLAGNVHLGELFPLLGRTLLPVWRYAAITAPLGDRLAQTLAYPGAVVESSGGAHYRIIGGDRLMWSAPVTTWDVSPRRFAARIRRHIETVFPQLRGVAIEQVVSGATGETVHGMPQIGELRRGFWIASGFGRQGLNTSALAGQLVASGLLQGDDRWRLFSPFELVWSGGTTGRVVGQAVYSFNRGQAAVAGALARYREGARVREQQREARRIAANEAVRAMRTGPQGPAPQVPPVSMNAPPDGDRAA